jgi:hypothetical protein
MTSGRTSWDTVRTLPDIPKSLVKLADSGSIPNRSPTGLNDMAWFGLTTTRPARSQTPAPPDAALGSAGNALTPRHRRGARGQHRNRAGRSNSPSNGGRRTQDGGSRLSARHAGMGRMALIRSRTAASL